MKKRLLILGPSFRRRRDAGLLPAFERFDGLFYRVARKYLSEVKDVDVIVMTDDLTLIEGNTPIPYREPIGSTWGKQKLSKETLEKAKTFNEKFLEEKLKSGQYSEIYLAIGKQYANALPDLTKFNIKVIFPTSGGLGPKTQTLKQWILKGEKYV